MNKDYEKAVELRLTKKNRWEDGTPHHPKSIRIMEFLCEHDFNDYSDCFEWKMGGDGDNGESLMYEMDAFFEMLDATSGIDNKDLRFDTVPVKRDGMQPVTTEAGLKVTHLPTGVSIDMPAGFPKHRGQSSKREIAMAMLAILVEQAS